MNTEMRDPMFFVPKNESITSGYVRSKNEMRKCKIDPITWKIRIVSPPIKNVNLAHHDMYFGYENGKTTFMSAKLGNFNHAFYGWELHCIVR